MKTICIKTNNKIVIDYLLKKLEDIELDDVYFSCHKFKVYTNIIIHYKGENFYLLLDYVSTLLSNLVIDIFENIIIKKIIMYEYFYFDNYEQKNILDKIKEILSENSELILLKKNVLYNCFSDYLKNENKLYLQGFITFRLKKYFAELEKIIDSAVNRYLIEKEYNEFISLLKMYVNSEQSQTDLVHLIYQNEEPILLDKDKNIIKCDLRLYKAKYLSDISFSACDMVLNTLLNLVPKKIYVHLIDNNIDEFITTLKLIFENRLTLCTDCKICTFYKFQKSVKNHL